MAETERKRDTHTSRERTEECASEEEKQRKETEMPSSRFAGSLSTPKVDVAIDMGNHFLNLTVDGFLKIGTVSFFFYLLV